MRSGPRRPLQDDGQEGLVAMEMFHEKVFDVQVTTSNRAYLGRLYVRLNSSALVDLIRLETNAPHMNVELQFPLSRDEGGAWLPFSLGEVIPNHLLPRLPQDVKITLLHSPRMYIDQVPASFATVEETTSVGLTDGSPTVRFELAIARPEDIGGRTKLWTAADDEDIYQCFKKLAREELVTFKICAHCRFADSPHFGGSDWRFGLYCFRDARDQQERLLREPRNDVWNSVAWSHVDAFHTCPSFEMAPHWLEPRKPQATPAPGPDPTEKS